MTHSRLVALQLLYLGQVEEAAQLFLLRCCCFCYYSWHGLLLMLAAATVKKDVAVMIPKEVCVMLLPLWELGGGVVTLDLALEPCPV